MEISLPAPPASRILQYFGLNGGGTAANPHTATRTPRLSERERMLGMITSFILDHGLEVSGANLTMVHGAISGIDHKLARMIDARLRLEQPVTQEWLDDVAGGHAYAAYRAELDSLLGKLETGIETFTRTTRETTVATGDYRAALEHHAQLLDQSRDKGQVVLGIADLAQAMLERTRQIESDVRRNETEARELRRSLAKARRDADVDHLTGLPNRRAFEALLNKHHAEAQSAGEPLTVAFCDIDHFKRINDTHGHDTGDRVIKAIGKALAGISGQNCHVARHGGEEFVVRRQNIWRNLRRRLAECGPRLGFDVRRRDCGVASADIRWSVA